MQGHWLCTWAQAFSVVLKDGPLLLSKQALAYFNSIPMIRRIMSESLLRGENATAVVQCRQGLCNFRAREVVES
jgi:hypothetical protein